MIRRYVLFGALVGVSALLVPMGAWAQTAPSLGSAKSFAVLGASTVTNTGPSVVTGDLGVSPGSSVTGFPPGQVMSGAVHAADSAALTAQAAASAAYNNLASQAMTQDLTGQNLGGLTLNAGVFNFSSSAQLTGILTLDAQNNPNAVFVFKIGSTLTTASAASVLVINGGSVCNVFWQVGSSATLGTGTSFSGNIIALASITVTTGASVAGRAFALNGAVTLDTNIVDASACNTVACPTITLTPSTMPGGRVGDAYSQTITASGGTGSYTFSVQSGALPAGLTLSTGGLLSGTPTAAGSFTVTIRAGDANACPGVITYTIVVAVAACPAISLAPATLASGTVGLAYSQTITASGGTGSYTFSVQSGALPAGLTLSTGGLLAGTPTAAGSATVTIRATDANACPGVITYTIVIAVAACPAISLAPATLASGTVGLAYSQTITASGGTGSYTFSVQSGALPAGLTLSTGGLVSGTPTAAGSFTVTIRAADANACPGVITYTVIITLPGCPVITLAPTTLPNGAVAVAYSQTITASGGTASYSYLLQSGALPVGLTLAPGGLLSGMPTTAASSTMTIRATDASACFGLAALTILVPAEVPILPPLLVAVLAAGLVATGYLALTSRRAR